MNNKKILYVDMDDVLCDYTGAYQKINKLQPDIMFPQSVAGFFETLKPKEKAIESFLLLDSVMDVYILTAPSVYNPLSYTEKRLWVECQLGFEFVHKLIISPNKGLLKGDYLIDDCVSGRGQEYFEGKLIHFGSKQYPDWPSIINNLMGILCCVPR